MGVLTGLLRPSWHYILVMDVVSGIWVYRTSCQA
jgi:hypothetical protein